MLILWAFNLGTSRALRRWGRFAGSGGQALGWEAWVRQEVTTLQMPASPLEVPYVRSWDLLFCLKEAGHFSRGEEPSRLPRGWAGAGHDAHPSPWVPSIPLQIQG